MSLEPSTNTSQSEKKKLLKQLSVAQRNYRLSVRWFRDTISYKNLVGEAWDSGRFSDLKVDADKANREAIADIFYWRQAISLIRGKLMDIADKKRKKKNGK